MKLLSNCETITEALKPEDMQNSREKIMKKVSELFGRTLSTIDYELIREIIMMTIEQAKDEVRKENKGKI